ncbi:hypothetical protein V1477_020295 [Vespula maculifrons]|uniref:Uncharacterized protein n=1 Tax=Vespula maculifrons TaxID=7453 RepID=A0ABD2APA8_VESMC
MDGQRWSSELLRLPRNIRNEEKLISGRYRPSASNFIGWVYKTAEVDLTTLKPGYTNETLILCQNIEELTSISIMNDVHGVSVGWLLLAACLVIVSATDYREGVFITLWC